MGWLCFQSLQDREFHPHPFPRPGLAVLVGLIWGLTSGCAFHYANARTGEEQLLGLGRLRLQTNTVEGPLQTITTSSTVPGLCIGLGPDHLGLSFGYVTRQKLVVMDAQAASALEAPTRASALTFGSRTNSAAWALGWTRMKATPARAGHQAVLTGRALAGAGLGLGGGDTGVRFGLQSQQMTVIRHENTWLTFAGTNRHWPWFDLFTLQVGAPSLADAPLPDGSNPSP
jgi:hypothetical protein